MALGVLAVLLVSSWTRPTAVHATRANNSPAGAVQRIASATGALRVARRFLDGYLPFVYGHAPAARITGASQGLERLLSRSAWPLPPAVRGLHPRVANMTGTWSRATRVTVRALVSDGESIEFPVTLQLTRARGLLLVTGVGGS